MTSSDPANDHPRDPAPASAGDPSMEDILASIRRILSEDEPDAQAQPQIQPQFEPQGPHAPPHGQGDATREDVLLLDASMMVPGSPPYPDSRAALPHPISGPSHGPPGIVPDTPVTPAYASPTEPPPPLHADISGGEPLLNGLVAPATAAAAASSVGALVRSIVSERSMQVYSGGPTIEDIVRAELRPQLKQWLDENLPPMVERLVRAELERVIGRAIP